MKKKPFFKKWSFWITFIIIILLFYACSSPTNEEMREKPKLSVDEVKQSAIEVDYDDLMRYNEDYVDKTIYTRGKVIQVMEKSGNKYFLRINVNNNGYSWKDTIAVWYVGDRLLEDDIVDVWGEIKGIYTYKALLGNQVSIPEIDSLYLELVEKGN
jgi:hypothetical protein